MSGDYAEMVDRAKVMIPSLWPEMLPAPPEVTIKFIAPIMVAFAKMEIARARGAQERE